VSDLKQAATNTVSIELDLDTTAYPTLDFSFYQNGRKIMAYTQDDVTIVNGTASFSMLAEDAAKLSPSRVMVEVKATAIDGTEVILSDGIVATVERSAHQ